MLGSGAGGIGHESLHKTTTYLLPPNTPTRLEGQNSVYESKLSDRTPEGFFVAVTEHLL